MRRAGILSVTAVAAATTLSRHREAAESEPEALRASPSGLPIASPSKPYWLEKLPERLQAYRNFRSSPTLPKRANVVIVGSGMSGVSTAYHLAQATSASSDPSVLLLDAREICGGATGRNGGFLHAHGLNEWWTLYKKYGARTATELCWFERKGREAINEVSSELAVDCDIDRDIKLVMLFPGDDQKGMKETLGAFYPVRSLLRAFGVRVLESAGEIAKELNVGDGQVLRNAVVLEKGCDTFWPAKFVLGVLEDCIERGVEVHAHTPVVEVTKKDGKVLVRTARGNVLCEKVVYATNAWTSALIPELAACIQPVLNTVVCTAPNNGALLADPLRRTGQSVHPGYHYFHQREDGRIVLGGFRHLLDGRGVGVFEDGAPSSETMESVRAFLPSLGFQVGIAIEHEWTGIIGWSMDGLPFVGPLPGNDTAFVCAGFSGHGMTQAWLSGKATANMVLGKAPGRPFVRAFLPSEERVRATSKLGGDWFSYEKAKQ